MKKISLYRIIRDKIDSWVVHIRFPENVLYGGSLTRKTALSCVGKGWSKLINNLYDAKPKDTRVIQVKEKFASLRFSVVNEPAWYLDLINYYEKKSITVCERCGKPGYIRTIGGWDLTLCDDCDKIEEGYI